MPKTPSPSIFRPASGVDQSMLAEHKALLQEIDRRKVLRGAVSLGALTMLTGCNVTRTDSVQSVLKLISQFNDKVQELLFRPNHLAPTFSESQVVKPPRFNAYYDIEDMVPLDAAKWKLELAGKIKDKRSWTAQQIYALPEQEWIVRHICVEGWDYIGQWSGVNLREFLERIGADLTAKYVSFKCADDYYGSIDMATALHPQTILATRYAKEPITDPFGFPLRLRTATKLGFKNPKWITEIEVTNQYRGGYWEDRGFNWFSGI
ncbi:MAG TPA: molybdopterin-dependent oxidoreductase [Xanthobacteraceae bacterium]|nr:molybdopterin-dependent oxidoreductase [Steroidobacteraceae bacterium]HKS64197.1 molybdopterin-dependent oxidoreductase [Xanthobacteraceae bacterium]